MLARFVRTSIARTAISASRSFSTEATSDVFTKPGGGATSSGGGKDTLGRRLLSLIFPKRSAVITIRKWIEEGKNVRKYELNRVVREIRKLGRNKHALEICEWMTLQQDMKLLPGDYAVHLDLIAKVRGLASAEKFFEDLPKKMMGTPTCTALLHNYVQNKLSDKAEALMKKMSECGLLTNSLPYNHMLSLYISTGQLDKVPAVIQALKKNTSPDVLTFNLWLTVCASKNDIPGAEKALLEFKKAKIDADWVTYSTLTNLYIKNDSREKAASTLKEMEKRVFRKSRHGYSSLITLYASLGDKDGVRRTCDKIKSTFRKMNDAEYKCMIASLVKVDDVEEAEKLYTEWESLSTTCDSRVSNILLVAYINKDQMEKAKSFYDRMVEKSISASYTTCELMTWGYLKTKNMDQVLEYFQKAVERVDRWEPDDRIVREIFESLEITGDIQAAERFLVILRKAGYVTTEIYNSLLRTYKNAGKMPLIVAERMKKDNVELDEETHQLIKETGKLCVGDASAVLS